MIAFIDDHRGAHGVEPICKVLPIAPSTYHDNVAKRIDPEKLSSRAKRDVALKPEIERVFAENFEVYGARKTLYFPRGNRRDRSSDVPRVGCALASGGRRGVQQRRHCVLMDW
jgi:hypothetical protein